MLPNGRRDSGGMNIYLKEMLRYLPPAGVAIDLFTMDHPHCVTPIYRISPRSRVIHIPAAPPDTPKERLYEYIHQFTQSVEQFILNDNASYTTVYSHYWWSGITGAAIARRMGIPHSITFHTLARLKQRYLAGNVEHPQRAIQEQVLAQTADRLIVWTPHEKEMLIKLYNAPADKISIIPPGVDTSSFRPLDRRAARAALGLDEPQKMILAVGRITKIKGLPLLIRAGSSLDTVADAKIHVVGGDTTKDSRRELCQQVTDLGMRDRVKLWGPMPHSRLPLMYAAADVFVMPSYYESFGLAAMEAAASATPTIATDVGGLRSAVADGRTGYLIPWRCPDLFMDKIELLLSNPHHSRQLGRRAHHIAKQWEWRTVAQKLLHTILEPATSRSLSVA